MSAIATHPAGAAVRPARAWAAAATGAAFAFFYLIGTASLNAPHGGSDQKIVDWWSKGNLLRYLPQLSYAAGSLALLAAAVAITAISSIIYRNGAFRRWLAWLGVVVSAAIVIANIFLAAGIVIPAVLIWALALSAAMLRAPRDVSPATVR